MKSPRLERSLVRNLHPYVSFWPIASDRFHMLLQTAQLMLAGIHSTKASWGTFAAILPLVVLTSMANSHCKRSLTPQLTVLPLQKSSKADELAKRRTSRLSAGAFETDDEHFAAFFEGLYVQRELSMPDETLFEAPTSGGGNGECIAARASDHEDATGAMGEAPCLGVEHAGQEMPRAFKPPRFGSAASLRRSLHCADQQPNA